MPFAFYLVYIKLHIQLCNNSLNEYSLHFMMKKKKKKYFWNILHFYKICYFIDNNQENLYIIIVLHSICIYFYELGALSFGI